MFRQSTKHTNFWLWMQFPHKENLKTYTISPGKKITEGMATTPVTESFVAPVNIPNPKFSQDFGLRHSASVKFCP